MLLHTWDVDSLVETLDAQFVFETWTRHQRTVFYTNNSPMEWFDATAGGMFSLSQEVVELKRKNHMMGRSARVAQALKSTDQYLVRKEERWGS